MRVFKWYRKKIGGEWVKTKEKGWITPKEHMLYLIYRFNPIILQKESYFYSKNSFL